MKCQIIRHQTYSRGSISNIGRETHRDGSETYKHKNENIDKERSHLNVLMGIKNQRAAWELKLKTLGIEKPKHEKNNLEQLMITASPEWFKERGWDKQKAKTWNSINDCPREILSYFNDALTFTKQWAGEENIIGVALHLDEENPHMHINFVGIYSGLKRKNIWEKDENGKIKRNENGSKIRARDEEGRVLYEYVEAPKTIDHDSYMRARGGASSYRNLQDRFFEEVAKNYGLERGEIGSKAKHRNHHEYSKIIEENALIINEKKQEKRLLEAEVEVLSEKVKATQEVLENLELEPYIQALKELGRTYQTMEKQIKEIEHYQKTLKSIKTYAITHEIKPLPSYIDKALQHDPNKQIDRDRDRSR